MAFLPFGMAACTGYIQNRLFILDLIGLLRLEIVPFRAPSPFVSLVVDEKGDPEVVRHAGNDGYEDTGIRLRDLDAEGCDLRWRQPREDKGEQDEVRHEDGSPLRARHRRQRIGQFAFANRGHESKLPGRGGVSPPTTHRTGVPQFGQADGSFWSTAPQAEQRSARQWAHSSTSCSTALW